MLSLIVGAHATTNNGSPCYHKCNQYKRVLVFCKCKCFVLVALIKKIFLWKRPKVQNFIARQETTTTPPKEHTHPSWGLIIKNNLNKKDLVPINAKLGSLCHLPWTMSPCLSWVTPDANGYSLPTFAIARPYPHACCVLFCRRIAMLILVLPFGALLNYGHKCCQLLPHSC